MFGSDIRRILAQRPMRKFLANQAVSAFATRGFDIVLVWLAVAKARSAEDAGIVLFFKFVPYVLFGLIGGWAGDVYQRWKLVTIADALRGFILLAFAACITQHTDTLTLSIIAFIFTTLRTLSQPASQAMLPDLMPNEEFGAANSLLHAIIEISIMVSPIFVGFALSAMPIYVSVMMLAVLFFGASYCVPRTQAPCGATDRAYADFRPGQILVAYGEIIAELYRSFDRILYSIVIVSFSILGVGGLLSFSMPLMMSHRGEFGAHDYGLTLAALSFGTMPGAYAASILKSKTRLFSIYGCWLTYGITVYCLSRQVETAGLVICGAIAGFFGAVADINLYTLIQENIQKNILSKIFAIFSTLANTCEAISSPMMATVVVYTSVERSFIVGLLIVLFVNIFGLYIALSYKHHPIYR